MRKEFNSKSKCCQVIVQLLEDAKELLCQAMLQLVEEAEFFGAEDENHSSEMFQELNAVVSEIYSLPRATRAARLLTKLGIVPGFAMDITTNDEDGEPWAFDKEEQKAKAERKVLDTCPDLLVGSPMCKDFSPWQRLNQAKSKELEKYEENKEYSRSHLELVCRNYNQYDGGRLLLHEHP